ncbi:hypothetical protein BJV82DRAFT_608127 [Fennellomyces sp. T-0311]|nr:hypothetical protein BJV82DRAFT_608127 [Fennellomyces sp. T-0311]
MSALSRYAQPIAITVNGIFAGLGLSVNLLAVPALRAANYPVRGWSVLYHNGARLGGWSILISSAAHFYTYYATKSPRALYCGLLSFASMPYTLFVMMPTSNRLEALNAMPNHDKNEAAQLIENWCWLQWFRTISGTAALMLAVF